MSGRSQYTLQERKDWEKQRTRVSNLVARRPEIDKICCICGKPADILHNRKEPYKIAFICKECRKDKQNLEIAEQHRFDVRTKLVKRHIVVDNYSEGMVVTLVLDFLNDEEGLTIGEYCEKAGITRYTFARLLERYQELFPTQPIKEFIKQKIERVSYGRRGNRYIKKQRYKEKVNK